MILYISATIQNGHISIRSVHTHPTGLKDSNVVTPSSVLVQTAHCLLQSFQQKSLPFCCLCSTYCHCPSPWRTSFNISRVLLRNGFSFHVHENVLVSPFLKDIFVTLNSSLMVFPFRSF